MEVSQNTQRYTLGQNIVEVYRIFRNSTRSGDGTWTGRGWENGSVGGKSVGPRERQESCVVPEYLETDLTKRKVVFDPNEKRTEVRKRVCSERVVLDKIDG